STRSDPGVIYMPISRLAIGLMLVVLAGTKATLVALFYMHLAMEKRTLAYTALTPAVLCVFLVFMLLPDLGAITRALTHASPPAASEAHHGGARRRAPGARRGGAADRRRRGSLVRAPPGPPAGPRDAARVRARRALGDAARQH